MSSPYDPQDPYRQGGQSPYPGPGGPSPGGPSGPGFAGQFTDAVGGVVGPKVGSNAPGSVITASAITIVCCIGFGLFNLINGLAVQDDADAAGFGAFGDAVLLGVLINLAICVLVAVGAFLAMRGSNPWRITVVVFASLWLATAVINLFGAISLESPGLIVLYLVGVVAGILAIVFYFQPASNQYYRGIAAAKYHSRGY